MSTDKIQLIGMVFYGYHGATRAEQETGQRFIIDLEVHRSLNVAGKSDDIVDTVNYSEIFRLVKKVVEGSSRKLIEAVAETIAQQILDAFDVDAVNVVVKKPEAPIKASILRYVSVEIHRSR